jgi:hypothetical protein
VGTSIGLAILGAIGADAAISAWTSQAAHLPDAARRAAIGQARNVASARISSVTRALGTGHRPAAEQAFSHGYQVAVFIAGLGLIAARSSPHSGYATTADASCTQPQASLHTRRPRPATPRFRHTT